MFLKNYAIQQVKFVLIRFPKLVIRFFQFLPEFIRFRKLNGGRFLIKLRDIYPCLKDKVTTTPFDHHYTYHPAWAARCIAGTRPAEHVDISSILYFGSMLSAFVPTRFYDYRPAELNLSGYQTGFADLNALPFPDNELESLSCMHTIEHIGLGRYGDKADGNGDLKAIAELKRVLKPGGNLYFVTPVGKPKIEYNAHRIYSFEQIVSYFAPLKLKEFSMVPDTGGFINNADPATVADQNYACGCFWFEK
ncbi:MAG: DUF268 domain-containing protein [Chitinophagaceae bacterium]|nr:MAG: DUF268 domain-containing protein [Chitinophagaceae bacterium]